MRLTFEGFIAKQKALEEQWALFQCWYEEKTLVLSEERKLRKSAERKLKSLQEKFDYANQERSGKKPKWGYFPTVGHPEVVTKFEGTKSHSRVSSGYWLMLMFLLVMS